MRAEPLPHSDRRPGRDDCWTPPGGTRTARRTSTSSSRPPGYRSLTTHIFVADSPYLDSDAVFAVKESLVADFPRVDDEEQARAHGVTAPFRMAEFDITVEPEMIEPGRTP